MGTPPTLYLDIPEILFSLNIEKSKLYILTVSASIVNELSNLIKVTVQYFPQGD